MASGPITSWQKNGKTMGRATVFFGRDRKYQQFQEIAEKKEELEKQIESKQRQRRR